MGAFSQMAVQVDVLFYQCSALASNFFAILCNAIPGNFAAKCSATPSGASHLQHGVELGLLPGPDTEHRYSFARSSAALHRAVSSTALWII